MVFMTAWLLVPRKIVWPSAGVRWKACAATVLPAPAMFSGTTGRPSSGPIASARMRPTMSVTPATATGITRRIGRLGKRSCARAGEAAGEGRRAGRGV